MENFLLISFVWNISDLMIIDFPFGYMFLSCNFRNFETFSRLTCFETHFILDFYTQSWNSFVPPRFIKSMDNYSNTHVCKFNKKHNISINNPKKTCSFSQFSDLFIFIILWNFSSHVNERHIAWKHKSMSYQQRKKIILAMLLIEKMAQWELWPSYLLRLMTKY